MVVSLMPSEDRSGSFLYAVLLVSCGILLYTLVFMPNLAHLCGLLYLGGTQRIYADAPCFCTAIYECRRVKMIIRKKKRQESDTPKKESGKRRRTFVWSVWSHLTRLIGPNTIYSLYRVYIYIPVRGYELRWYSSICVFSCLIQASYSTMLC